MISTANPRDPSRPAAPRPILEQIVAHKQQEVAQLLSHLPLVELQAQVAAAPAPRDFLAALQQNPHHPSLIAEVKKASPSRGLLRPNFDPVVIAQAYECGGAACLSVLTDQRFFQGGFAALEAIRQRVDLPLLCKEFVIDPYQIYRARAAGADAVLLIAAILSDHQLQAFLNLIHDLNMTALVEVHSLAELDRVLTLSNLRLLGINNRNLADFTVRLDTTQRLVAARQIQLQDREITVVSESGLYGPEDLALAAQAGARAVLVGESLVRQSDPEQAVCNLLSRHNTQGQQR